MTARRAATTKRVEGPQANEKGISSGFSADQVSTASKRRRKLPDALQAAIDAAVGEDTRSRAEVMRLMLPFPPSVNSLYPTIVNADGRMVRVKSKASKSYAAKVGVVVGLWMRSHDCRPPAPPYRLAFIVWPPKDGLRHDLTNCFKAPEDALMSAIDGDDVHVLAVTAQKMPPDEYPRLEVTLEHIEPAAPGAER